jgi:hypothetical protein
MLNEVLQDRRIQLIPNLLLLPHGQDESGVPQHSQMTGDGRPGGIEAIGDFSRVQGTLPKHLEDFTARGIGERPEYVRGWF